MQAQQYLTGNALNLKSNLLLDKLPVTTRFALAGRNVDQRLEPLENALTGYLPFPGFEIKNKFIRMIGADIG